MCGGVLFQKSSHFKRSKPIAFSGKYIFCQYITFNLFLCNTLRKKSPQSHHKKLTSNLTDLEWAPRKLQFTCQLLVRQMSHSPWQICNGNLVDFFANSKCQLHTGIQPATFWTSVSCSKTRVPQSQGYDWIRSAIQCVFNF